MDLAIGALRSAGIENCSVNAGGDLRVAGLAQQVHLRHPAARSGRAYLGGCSFSVIAPSCMAADALTKTAIFASGPIAERVLREYDARLLVLSG